MDEEDKEADKEHISDDEKPKTKKCPFCSEEILVDAKKCKHCGEWLDKELKAEHIAKPVHDKPLLPQIEKISDAIPTWFFIILNILSFGMYQIYWLYGAWKFIKDKEKSDINTIGRAIFSVVFAYTLFEKILVMADKKGFKKGFPPEVIAVAYYVFDTLAISFSAVGVNIILIPFTFIPLLSVLDALNFYYRSEKPGYKDRTKPIPIEIGIVILGIIIWALVIKTLLEI